MRQKISMRLLNFNDALSNQAFETEHARQQGILGELESAKSGDGTDKPQRTQARSRPTVD
jgi:hypothetical protein